MIHLYQDNRNIDYRDNTKPDMSPKLTLVLCGYILLTGKTKRHTSRVAPSPRKFMVHSQPREIEEVLPLARTYGAEPKVTTFQQIAEYISKHYASSNPEDLQAALRREERKKRTPRDHTNFRLRN